MGLIKFYSIKIFIRPSHNSLSKYIQSLRYFLIFIIIKIHTQKTNNNDFYDFHCEFLLGNKWEEQGSFKKGHKTAGKHEIHKLDEFKKEKKFFDEDGDEG